MNPIELELFTNRFSAIASEMGEILRRTSLSTNVKERLDFSCGILNAEGRLVVNAPHVPVHLGALGECVRRVSKAIPFEPGDVIVTNHPAFGGSHLPDVTVITPYFHQGKLIATLASRAHHAEIGGTRPGSMPPAATRLVEEGVIISPRKLATAGRFDWDGMRKLLQNAPYPTRSVEENLADLNAAVAANHRGGRALEALVAAHGTSRVLDAIRALESRAERQMRQALVRLGNMDVAATELLDDGTPLCVSLKVLGDSAVIDFEGTGARHPGNLNATPAIVRSAVIYVLRLLLEEPLPLNEGLLNPIKLKIPKGSLLDPEFVEGSEPAVVGGNIETSQRLVDTLIKALGVMACGQGTMNNIIFGSERFGYYETVCGGAGAGPGFNGASGVHVHMTNTKITDPELLERRYPVRLERFEIRRGSGGDGEFRGGDGVTREITFLEKTSLSLLTQHRVVPPYGKEGGSPGELGNQRVVRADGTEAPLGSIDGVDMEPGDKLVVNTPGGGGWGKKPTA